MNVPVIPLKPLKEYEKLDKEEISQQVNLVARGQTKRKTKVITCNELDPELLIRTILDFQETCVKSKLNIGNGVVAKGKLRKCLGDVIKDEWDTIVDDHVDTMNGFNNAVRDLVKKLIKPDGIIRQKQYLQRTKKPMSMTVAQTATRLKYLNKLLLHFPKGSAQQQFTEFQMKDVLLRLMPVEWIKSFENTTRELTNDDYEYLSLVTYLQKKEHQEQEDRLHTAGRREATMRGGRRRGPFHQRSRRITSNNNGSRNGAYQQRNSNQRYHPYLPPSTNFQPNGSRRRFQGRGGRGRHT